jgi:phosphoglycerol transferase MdoB-like AlkP superfamily enzyme
VVSYTDNALRKFFDAARKTDWYENTTFIITADHSGQGLHREYNDYDGWYRIPMLVYRPLYEEVLVPLHGKSHSCHQVSPRLMQQTDIMPTLLDYLGIQTSAVCFGTSVFRNPDNGWQIAYGNGYYQLETQDGVAVLGQEKEEVLGFGNIEMLKAIVQQYNHRLINDELNK